MFNENTNRDGGRHSLKCKMGIIQAHDFDHGELGKKVILINLSEMAHELSLY